MLDIDKMLATVGLPPLGARWTPEQLALGIGLALLAMPLLLWAALVLGLWRLFTRQARSWVSPGEGGWHGPYTDYHRAHSLTDWSVAPCRHCGATIKPFVDACPFCGRSQG